MAAFDANPMTLTRYILVEQKRHPEASGDLSIILSALATACKAITAAVRRAGLMQLHGLADAAANATGDAVKKLDVIANDIFINSLKHTGLVSIMVSEENEEAVLVPDHPEAHYALVFDPLDGSSNIDCNVSVGSIFGIYRRKSPGGAPSTSDVLQDGNALVVSGYAMYGSSTELVLTFGEGVHVFSLDPSVGEFLMTRKGVMIPEKPQRIYSTNEGNERAFPAGLRKFIEYAKSGPKPYSLRYVGSMVADVHRTLLYGGVFMYPPTAAAPSGKLRLLYEGNPMAHIVEQAGGIATTGLGRVMDLQPTSIHERTPIYVGCKRDVDLILGYLNEEGGRSV